jgi:hypothetical protein
MASKIKVDQLETADGSGTIALQNQLSGMTTASLPALGSAQMPTGSVLQVVHGSYSTSTTTTSGNTWVETGASLAITPTSASSKILVMFNHNIRLYSSSADQGAGYAIRRGTTTVWSTPNAYATYIYATSDEADMRVYQSFNYLDSPNTTSATTYSTRMIEYGNGTTYAQPNSNPTMITLMEIAG